MKRHNKIKVFYTPNQVLREKIRSSYSKSPLKPMLLMSMLDALGIGKNLDVDGTFRPFDKEDFLTAHTPEYVNDFFSGVGLCSSNSLPWSPELADSVRYTNSSLYHAIKHSLENPEQISFSPTSGFHHAHPGRGSGFCTFAGQVIAAIKLYEEKNVSGAVFDLDGHFGNSIEDGRHNPDKRAVDILNKAIPMGFNVNPRGQNQYYLDDLKRNLARVELFILADRIQYVMWCHGADSHSSDDLGGQVDTEHWVKCSEVFYAWVKQLDEKLAVLGRPPLPVTLSLFGGYRADDYASVLSLHTKDIVTCLNTLCLGDNKIVYQETVKTQKGPEENWINGVPESVFGIIGNAAQIKPLPPMSKNEKEILSYLEKDIITEVLTGNELGMRVKGWKNHSMYKWANRLVERGKLVKAKTADGKAGFVLKDSPVKNNA